jgi:hypothetical protein
VFVRPPLRHVPCPVVGTVNLLSISFFTAFLEIPIVPIYSIAYVMRLLAIVLTTSTT